MYENVTRLTELLKTDEGFRAKLKEKAEAYTGEKNEEAAFRAIVVPAAEEYGLTVSWEEMKAYADSVKNRKMDPDELGQVRVAGGERGYGAGAIVCDHFGMGLGVGGGTDVKGDIVAGICFCLGMGQGILLCIALGDAGD